MPLLPNPVLKPLPHLLRLNDEEMAALTARLSLRQCATLTELTFGECARRGLRRVQLGSKFFCSVEARVAADVVRLELDLDEVAAQIEEARWETMFATE